MGRPNNSTNQSSTKSKCLCFVVLIDGCVALVGRGGSWRQSNKQTKSISSNQLIDLWIDWCRCLFDGCAAGLTALILFHQISFQSIWFHFNGSLPHQWNSNTFNSQSIFIKDWWNWIVGLFPWAPMPVNSSFFSLSCPLGRATH